MLFNILKISASNALKMFLNIIDSIGRAVVSFHSHKQTGSINVLYQLTAALAHKKGIQ